MNIQFYKYQGAGNDFIVLDNRNKIFNLSTSQIEFLCDRRFGVGADGLMMLEEVEGFDFKMIYYNADGNESTMCGNGGRCIVLFAQHLKIISDSCHFLAIDGAHTGSILDANIVSLSMSDVNQIQLSNNEAILDTGSPHIVFSVKDLATFNVENEGKKIRNEQRFGAKGINVNFIEKIEDIIHIRTFERGVEAETLACGTGVTAAAICSVGNEVGKFTIPIIAKGGNLEVSFEKKNANTADNIFLTGPAAFVFEGKIEL